MKTMKYKVLVFLMMLIASPAVSFGQNDFENKLNYLKSYCNNPNDLSMKSYIHYEIEDIFRLVDKGDTEAMNFIKSPRKYLSGDNDRIEEIEKRINSEINLREYTQFKKLTSKLDLANFFIIDSLAKNGNQRAQEYLNSSKRASDETFQNCLKYKNITSEDKDSVIRLKKEIGGDAEILRLARYYAKLGDWYDVEKMLAGWTYVIGNPLFEREKLQILNKKDAEECYKIAEQYEGSAHHSYGEELQQKLDSAEVWYKHAASFDAKYKEWVTAIEFKKKTGKDYWEEKEKQKQQNEQQAYVNSLIKKYGKQYVTAASNGNTIIGMPEEVFLAYSSPVSRTLIEQTATTKIYRVSHTGLISGRTTYEYIWFKNGRVTRIKK